MIIIKMITIKTTITKITIPITPKMATTGIMLLMRIIIVIIMIPAIKNGLRNLEHIRSEIQAEQLALKNICEKETLIQFSVSNDKTSTTGICYIISGVTVNEKYSRCN